MANTGQKQATVAYKVRASDNAPLDTDGNPIVVNGVPTGRRQAIAVLTGSSNPNPLLYDVEFYYSENEALGGTPTIEISNDCLTGYIYLSETQIILQISDPAKIFLLTSSGAWSLLSDEPGGTATLIPASGERGQTYLTLTRTAVLGQGYFTFINDLTGQTARVYVVNVDVLQWILENGTWDPLGFWLDGGIWKSL